jgi:hypothetical protein
MQNERSGLWCFSCGVDAGISDKLHVIPLFFLVPEETLCNYRQFVPEQMPIWSLNECLPETFFH